MASEEHISLAAIVKGVHDSLRNNAKLIGAKQAWKEHLKDEEQLKAYADAMHRLANIWEHNANNDDERLVHSRVKWTIDYCIEYFFTERIYLDKREREERLIHQLKDQLVFDSNCMYLNEELPSKIRVLDVGSCFNPFANTPFFEVIAIDLCPVPDKSVFRGDFLHINVEYAIDVNSAKSNTETEINVLPTNYFECVVFSLLLEYIPSSMQRLECCQKAYKLLKSEGILIIITPDSSHVGKNAKLMKTWQYVLATLGFLRIRFEKLSHITCMVFRKAIVPQLAFRWAETHRQDYMSEDIEIPQDSKSY